LPEGGLIKVRAENIVVGKGQTLPLKKGNYIRISTQDQGIGMSEEYLQKIFDPYFTTKQKGSGLGLATAYSIIKRHDGYIEVESELGAGSTFKIYLPAYSREAFIGRGPRQRIPVQGKGKILLMDDEELVRKVAGEMLEVLGYDVEFARDGTAAIELYEKAKRSAQPFEVIILDLTVPGGMGGKETIRKLIEIDPGTKAIVSSGYSNDPVMAEFGKYGFRAVVAKPYKIEELGQILHEVIIDQTAKSHCSP
jgi:two-component system cell cycle sensor histidine kinase/response regulator CckA